MSIPFGPILVVEDTPNVLELLEVALRFKGYPVVTARNGKEALEQIAKERPSMVITDILMPTMDGYALAHSLRKDPRTASIPILFISATYITPDDKRFALSLGASRFIEKPIDTGDFLLTVAEILTQGVDHSTVPELMPDSDFYMGYRARLESKLRYKQTQVARTERLLDSLPEEQRPAFEALLHEIQREAGDIQAELEEVRTLSASFQSV